MSNIITNIHQHQVTREKILFFSSANCQEAEAIQFTMTQSREANLRISQVVITDFDLFYFVINFKIIIELLKLLFVNFLSIS